MSAVTQKRTGLYKISDLSRETGVPTATIKYYLREGLLPRATLKTGRNMAYYDHSFVDRIRCIRELQSKRHLPLDVIRAILERNSEVISPREVGTLLGLEGRFYEEIHYAPGLGCVPRNAVGQRYGFGSDEIDYLVDLGILTPCIQSGEEVFEGDDVLILENFAAMREAGLSSDFIPHESALPVYVETFEALARKELELFSRAAGGDVDEARLAEMALAGVKLVGQFIVLLRRKLLLRAIQQLREESESEPVRAGN